MHTAARFLQALDAFGPWFYNDLGFSLGARALRPKDLPLVSGDLEPGNIPRAQISETIAAPHRSNITGTTSPCEPVYTGTESDAVMGTARVNTSLLPHLHLANSFLPPSRSHPAAVKLMPTPNRAASSPSAGHAGLQPVPVQPVSKDSAAREPTLTRLEQPSQERLVFDRLRRLTVRLLVDTFSLRVNELFGDTRIPLKRFWNSTRCWISSLWRNIRLTT